VAILGSGADVGQFSWQLKKEDCLMTSYARLILQPGEAMSGLGQLMKRLSGRQTRFVNRQEFRTGTFWEGRYRSSPIETNTYLLACCR
jgi:putative transposase